MTERVWITISGVRYEDGQKEEVETAAAGTYFEKGGTHYIRYDQEDGEDFIHNMIKIRTDRMEIVKKGAVDTRMIFEKGRKNAAPYMTLAGRLLMEISTREFMAFQSGKLVGAETEYALAINGQHVSDNRITVRVTSAG